MIGFALGVLIYDVAARKPDPVCERAKENAERFATLLAHVLNGGGLVVEGSTAVSCRAKHIEEKI